MTLLRIRDIEEKSDADLETQLEDLRKELFQAKMSFHSRKLENTASLKETRKSIARIITILKQRGESQQNEEGGEE